MYKINSNIRWISVSIVLSIFLAPTLLLGQANSAAKSNKQSQTIHQTKHKFHAKRFIVKFKSDGDYAMEISEEDLKVSGRTFKRRLRSKSDSIDQLNRN